MLNLLFRPLDVDNSSCKNADCVGSDIVGAHEQKTTATREWGREHSENCQCVQPSIRKN